MLAPILGVVFASGCAIHAFVPPSGADAPASNALAAWTEASGQCHGATTFSASIHLSGRAGGERLRGTIEGAVTTADQIYLRAHAVGQTLFRLAGTAERATLLLPHDNRVLIARAADIIEALTALAWTPSELMHVISGCVANIDATTLAAKIGDRVRFTSDATDVYLRPRNGHWTLEGAVLKGVTVGYDKVSDGWAHQIVIARGGSSPIAIKLALDQIDTKDLPSSAYSIAVPADATPLTLDEFRSTMGIKRQ